jgi:hypothetical protein
MSYFQLSGLKSAKRKGFLALGLVVGMCLMPGLALAKYDIVHLYNGSVVKGKVISSPGELIRMRIGLGGEDTIRRVEMQSRKDVVITTDRKMYRGEVNYVDPFKLEIITDAGRVTLWRLLINKIIMGVTDEQYYNASRSGADPSWIKFAPVEPVGTERRNTP